MKITKKTRLLGVGIIVFLLLINPIMNWGFKASAAVPNSENSKNIKPTNENENYSLSKGLETFWNFTGFANLMRPETFGVDSVNVSVQNNIATVRSKNNPSIILAQGVFHEDIEIVNSHVLDYSNRSFDARNLLMICIGLFFIILAIKRNYEPLLLVPIGVGIIIGNIPFLAGYELGIYESDSVMNYLYFGVIKGVYPPIIFLGIGAMTDFSTLISNPKLFLIGAAAQLGIFGTFLGAMYLGFDLKSAGAISIIGGADGPTAIFLSSKLNPNLLGAIAIAAYSYMALIPLIQPPIMRLIVPKKERLIKMKPPRAVSKTEKIIFPIAGLILTTFIVPSALPLLGMLFFGNILKESGVTERLAYTARNSMINIVTILLGLTVGASTQADVFLTADSVKIFVLGAISFTIATSGGLLFARFMNLFLRGENKINPLIGAAGVSAVPNSARVVQVEGIRNDSTNHLLMHAMAPNVSGIIGSAVAAGILLSMLS